MNVLFNKYKLSLHRDGINIVKVFQHKNEGEYENYWNIPLLGDDEPIILSEYYTEDQFVIINWTGWIRLYNADKKELIIEYKLNGNIGANAIFSVDRTKVYVCLYNHEHESFLATLDLSTPKIEIQEIANFYNSYLQIRQDGCLLFYKHDWEYANKEKKYSHGFTVFNPETKEQQYFSLPQAPCSSYDIVKPFIDTRTGLGVMPYYGDVGVTYNEKQNPLFVYKIQLIDLTTFATETVAVREFEINELGCYDYTNQELATHFLEKKIFKEYQQAVSEFCENLHNIVFVSDGFWLCWRGGVVRKVNYDKTLSPMFIPTTVSNDSRIFHFSTFHAHLYKVTEEALFFKNHDDYYVFNLSKYNFQNANAIHEVALTKLSEEQLENISLNQKQQNEILGLGKIKIQVDDLSDESEQLLALNQIYDTVKNRETLGIGSKLLFQFEDKKETVLDEATFFSRVIQIEESKIVVQKIIEVFCTDSKAKECYRNEEETALCYAVLELAKQGETFLTTVLHYLSRIDLDHDVFNMEYIIPYLNEKYNRTTLKKSIALLSSDLLVWFEHYWQEIENE
ncbi:hypothetical protein [Flavobacterium sp. J27]|uniref:hypothetical protein n=1 Tax=Flavobacterium sp. J27 TaxID=2060419 RepID=UPI0010303B68|nr:hypothetical protein [Flavobacterium sp. J27]